MLRSRLHLLSRVRDSDVNVDEATVLCWMGDATVRREDGTVSSFFDALRTLSAECVATAPFFSALISWPERDSILHLFMNIEDLRRRPVVYLGHSPRLCGTKLASLLTEMEAMKHT